MIISTDTLSLFLIKHSQNGVCDRNICLIQELVRSDEPARSKFKRLCMYLTNLTLITKIETPGEFQVTYGHTSVRKKYLGETVIAFALTGSLKTPAVVMIDAETVFCGARKISVSQPLKSS